MEGPINVLPFLFNGFPILSNPFRWDFAPRDLHKWTCSQNSALIGPSTSLLKAFQRLLQAPIVDRLQQSTMGALNQLFWGGLVGGKILEETI